MMTRVKIVTSDDKEFQVDKKLILQSNLIKGMLEDLQESQDSIPLPNVHSSIMEIVLKYAELHQDDKPSSSNKKDVSQEDQKLMDVPKKTLFEIVLAANYLDFTGLLELGCKVLALDLKDKSIDQVVQDYNVPPEHQFTPQQREKIEAELRWADSANV